MPEIDLLRALPKTKRNLQQRTVGKDPEVVRLSKQFGELYFDGPREYGYGGYRYDGRWQLVARDIIAHYGLKSGMRVLDIGCAKGFLVKDLLDACSGLEVFGLDISEYALKHCPPEVGGRLHLGNCEFLPFPDGSFDLVLGLDVIHNQKRDGAIRALREIVRVGKGNAFVRVDSYRTPEQKAVFEDWVLTAEFHDYPDGWLDVFKEAGYQGDWAWTIIS
ncbi:class I SAM-dependent methyltransferase [Nisaea sp.]|uniref:class I SAM-dependent methyltransferase n=1 Tax=Nisaea sp. TaxID=2024842 RepID=UPI003297E19C